MDIEHLREKLTSAFNPAAAEHFDGSVRLQLGHAEPTLALHLLIRSGDMHMTADHSSHADLTLYFDDPAHAHDILTGAADPISSFMDHRFRSDGYLIWVFAVMGMFR